MDELFPLVNADGTVVGSALRSECHNGSKLLHPVVHLHVFNSRGELLLQKRSMRKDIQPGRWDTSVGGHVDFGESIETALLREAREELGIAGFEVRFLRNYVFESDIERELVHSYQTIFDGPFTFDPYEIDEIRFWSLPEIAEKIGKSMFTPNFEDEFRTLFAHQNAQNP
ncbi:MAG: NUDIX domain-containing protein [Candidatus Symbiothrix sp.]|jgi:isopentenyldiphosphate isomerase|nr:NUDIX domain-containing protein [Candidatus Symbiothrix sp.]